MSELYAADAIIINPLYDSVEAFAVDYDYDLLGRPISWRRRFLANPLLYMYNALQGKAWSVAAVIFALGFGVLVFIGVVETLKYLVCFARDKYVTLREIAIERKIWDKRKKFLQHEDYDRYAAVYCRSETKRLGITKADQPLPRDLPDYEAIRFVFQEPWLVEKTHMALHKSASDISADQMVEGELEDMLKVALRRNLMPRRKPLSVFGKVRARHLLAKGEGKGEELEGFTPEMLLHQGWEALHQKHLKLADDENYQFWVGQEKTLPVEAREVVGRLRPMMDKGRKIKRLINAHKGDEAGITRDSAEWAKKAPVSDSDTDAAEISTRPKIALSPPTIRREFGLEDKTKEAEESRLLRQILGMGPAHRARLRKTRKSGPKKSSRKHRWRK